MKATIAWEMPKLATCHPAPKQALAQTLPPTTGISLTTSPGVSSQAHLLMTSLRQAPSCRWARCSPCLGPLCSSLPSRAGVRSHARGLEPSGRPEPRRAWHRAWPYWRSEAPVKVSNTMCQSCRSCSHGGAGQGATGSMSDGCWRGGVSPPCDLRAGGAWKSAEGVRT